MLYFTFYFLWILELLERGWPTWHVLLRSPSKIRFEPEHVCRRVFAGWRSKLAAVPIHGFRTVLKHLNLKDLMSTIHCCLLSASFSPVTSRFCGIHCHVLHSACHASIFSPGVFLLFLLCTFPSSSRFQVTK